MKVAIIDTEISGSMIGGAQTFLPELLTGLNGKGHEVHFVTSDEPNMKVLPKLRQSGAALYTDIWDTRSIVNDKVPVFADWLRGLDPDVFVVSTTPDMGWVLLPLLAASTATIAIAHSNFDAYYLPLEYYRDFVTRAVGVSHEICENFRIRCGIAPERIDWIPYGITLRPDRPEDLSSPAVPIKLVYVGRLYEEHKRVSDLCKVVAELERRGTDYSLKIIGEGPVMPTMQEEMSKEIAGGRVTFLGWLGNAELLENLRESEVSLLVSDSEGFPIALVEAMAYGCAPVVTDIKSGTEQLVEDGVNGFVVPVGDAAALADRISILAADRGRLIEFRRRAWETGQQYSVERMVDAYEMCFERAVADARANPRRPDPDFPLMPSCRSKYPLWMRRLKAGAKRLVTNQHE